MNTRGSLVSLLGMAVGLSLGTYAWSNPVADWHAVIEPNLAGSGRKNAVAFPFYAYLDVAMYDAMAAIDHHYRPFAVRVPAPRGASEDAAVATAAHDVLVHFVPTKADAFDAALVSSLAQLTDGQSKTDGIAVGHAVAASWIAKRSGDGLEAVLTYTPGHGPGIWEPVPTFPAAPPNTPPPPVGYWLTQFKPFALTSADQFLKEVPPPPALTSKLWAKNYNLTKDYGAQNSTVRTAAETEIGKFWTDDAAAQYSRAFRGLIDSEQLNTSSAARLGLMISVIASDSITACFNAKYHFAFWRPYTAIHDADTDGNAATVPDSNWTPLAVTPGHPEYPAAHGCLTESVVDAISAYFGTDEVPFTVNSVVTGTTHQFSSLEDVVTEVDAARVFGGMHYRHSTKAGNRLGRRVAEHIVAEHFLNDD